MSALLYLLMSRFYLVLGLFCIALTGCIDVDLLVKVKPDGSGTVRETLLARADMGAKVSGKPITIPAKPMSDAQVAMKIAALGGKARLVSNQPMAVGDQVGYQAVFAFDDINQLKLPINTTGSDFFSFRCVKGSTTRLEIINSKDWIGEATREQTEQEKKLAEAFAKDPKMQQAMREMMNALGDARIAIRVEVEGEVLSSNAQHQQGNVIDLMSMDFNRAKRSPQFTEAWQMQNGIKKWTKDEMLSMRIPGIRMELQKEIFAEYLPRLDSLVSDSRLPFEFFQNQLPVPVKNGIVHLKRQPFHIRYTGDVSQLPSLYATTDNSVVEQVKTLPGALVYGVGSGTASDEVTLLLDSTPLELLEEKAFIRSYLDKGVYAYESARQQFDVLRKTISSPLGVLVSGREYVGFHTGFGTKFVSKVFRTTTKSDVPIEQLELEKVFFVFSENAPMKRNDSFGLITHYPAITVQFDSQ